MEASVCCECGDPHDRVWSDREDGFGVQYCVSCGKICGGAMALRAIENGETEISKAKRTS